MLKVSQKELITILSVILFLSDFRSSQASPALQQGSIPVKGLLLKQWSCLFGSTEVTVSKLGMRMRIPERKVVILMAPPNWNVIYFNQQRPVFYECQASEWRSPITNAAALFRTSDASELKPINSVFCLFHELDCRKVDLETPKGEKSDTKHTWQQLLVDSGELYVLREHLLPKSVEIVLAKTYGTTIGQGVPLSLKVRNNRHQENLELKLRSHNTVIVKSSDFVVPNGYKRVESVFAVTESKQMNADFAELIH